jgi:hypothetical protein
LRINLGEVEDKRFELSEPSGRRISALNCLSPAGEFSKRLERALD